MDEGRWKRLLGVLERGPAPVRERPLVLFHTPWQMPWDGWCVAARLHARAMAAGGLDVRLIDWKADLGLYAPEPDPAVLREVEGMTGRPGSWDAHVFSAMLGGAWQMEETFKHLLAEPGPQAYHCVFERNYLEPALVEQLNKLHGVWAQCEGNYKVLQSCGVTNATWIPFPFFEDDPHLQLPKPLGSNRFLWIGREEPRKDPARLVQAFLRAFKPGEASLTMKMSPSAHVTAYPKMENVIEEELLQDDVLANGWKKNPIAGGHIRIVRDNYSHEQMVRLQAEHDVYVVPSRGEGLEMGAYAAKLAGRRIVATECQGPEDFLDPGSDFLVPATGLVPASGEYDWGENATYIDYALEDLIAAMQKARAAEPGGSRRWPRMELHKAKAVGQRMRAWVEELCARPS